MMMENEANPPANPLNPRLDNFKGKVHTFTKEDSIKGGQARSKKKSYANSINPVIHGKYARNVPHCNLCPFKSRCNAYNPQEPDAACKVIDIPNYMQLMSALTFTSEEEFDDFINKQIQRMYLKNMTTDDIKKMADFTLIVLRVKMTKYRTPREQTINLQINNFTSEFIVFKDVTLKVLNKHPEVMQEWRAAIESAKQSN
jgi:adenine-specific DNA glycosylase